MSAPQEALPPYQVYWDAIRERVCSVCLDARDDGRCGLGRRCAIEVHVPAVVEAVLEAPGDRMDGYIAAVEARVCAGCSEQDASGRCRRRDRGECALSTYLWLVIDAVEQVRSRTRA